jgi:hypothetical protein
MIQSFSEATFLFAQTGVRCRSYNGRKAAVIAELSDEALVERVKAQDVTAFTLLYDRYAPAIYALVAHLLDPTDAEEVVQADRHRRHDRHLDQP